MAINLGPVFAGQVSYADLVRDFQHADLYTMTDEFFATIKSILSGATDATVRFVPHDPASSEPGQQGWPVSHIVAHFTATLEEGAAISTMQARGVTVEGRLRYETPWEELATLALVQARLAESQRICHSLLNAWPDQPHLDVTRTLVPVIGPMNAIGLYAFALGHGQQHLDQLREAVHQANLV